MMKSVITSLLLMMVLTAPAQQYQEAFARGADISWCTEMESQGMKFYNNNGNETEIFKLMKQIGMNAIRLRVWVNPENGYGAWSDKADVLVKARRAQAQGLSLMIDFHYSDYFADPGRQTKPAAWTGLSFDQLKTAVANHTKDILQAMKDENIEPKWVQVGNETNNGMIWEDGRINWNASGQARWGNYVDLSNAGYDAVKEVFPNAYVIVHFPNAVDDPATSFREFKTCGGKFDMIGLSHYPDWTKWEDTNTTACNNAQKLYRTFRVPVMFVETGYSNWDEERAERVMKDLFQKVENKGGIVGILYWEPEVYGGWDAPMLQDDGTWKEGKTGNFGQKVTSHGAFTPYGQPAPALLAFGDRSATGIQDTHQSSPNTPIHYYNIKGQRVNKDTKGVVLVKQGNTVKKIFRP